ncbi:hypothetical protein BCV72DRAFT_234736 [Rhizopus microsporus var. microsporus]|uniref:Uncharacterized protein n=1 Tax=Rhizopus microsporus var. microsporus TaxID=86635 RepID=A0A1X0QRI6_RHIZD|nr:hypothetical protein BCV72DRAFT_234736 [Rhizopus microsporus var. microsporus]
MHLYKAHLFSDGQIKNYSEEDYKVKFWSFILEELFGSSSVTIKWWDTVPNSFRSLDTEPNLDLRVISSPSTARLDDFDKQCKVAKVHLDKLKLVLVAKHHLNYYHKKMKTDNILIPFMLITGFDCQLLGLRLIQPKLYCLDNIGTFSFPINKKHIKEGAIEDIVNILTFARVQAIELKNKINNLERTKHISKLAKDLRSTSGRDAWCTDVIWPSDQVIPGFAEEEKAEDNE